jgi:hypothetical protein
MSRLNTIPKDKGYFSKRLSPMFAKHSCFALPLVPCPYLPSFIICVCNVEIAAPCCVHEATHRGKKQTY